MLVAIYGRKVNKQTAEYFIKLLQILEEFGFIELMLPVVQDKIFIQNLLVL